MVDTINELTELSLKLNSQSDKLNSIISTLNAKLAKLNLGIEVWLKNSPIHSSDYTDHHDTSGNWTHRDRKVILLGYARVDNDWQLCVKGATLETVRDEAGEEHEETINLTVPQPLLKASRQIRTGAMDYIPAVLDDLKDRGQKILESIRKAEQAAEKL